MQTFTYTVLNGCLPCCKSCGITAPMATGDEVNLYLNQDLIPLLPEKIEATVVSVSIIGTKTEYVFEYDEADIASSGVLHLVQCLIKGYPTCRTALDDLEDRVEVLEGGGGPVEDPLLTARVVLLEDQVFPAQTTRVCGLTELLSALNDPGELTIELTCDVTFLTGTYTIPYNKFIIFGKFKFIQGGDAKIDYFGGLPSIRQHFFSGFRAGQIRGPFHESAVLPEWWGIEERLGDDPTNPTNEADLRDDIALNCAFASAQLNRGNGYVRMSIKVSLAMGIYFVARPLWATPSIELDGAGGGRTKIRTTPSWQPLMNEFDSDYVRVEAETTAAVDCEYWPEQLNIGNHSAVLFMGGDMTTGIQNTFRSTIRNLWIDATYASQYNWNLHISGITALTHIEEMTLVENVMVEYASGFGIGVERNRRNIDVLRSTSGFTTISQINGLTLRNFEITGACKQDQVPVYLPIYCFQAEVSNATINMSARKSLTIGHSYTTYPTNYSSGYAFPPYTLAAVDGRPLVMQNAGVYHTYPDYGVVAQGNASIHNLHIEGVVNGVFVRNSDLTIVPNSITVENINCLYLMDRARGAVWSIDGMSGMDLSTTPHNPSGATPSNAIPVAAGDWNGYSCCVLIDWYEGSPNLYDSVVLKNIHANGGVLFMLRDRAFGWNHRSWCRNNNKIPATFDWYQTVTSYERGNVYVSDRDNTTVPPYAYVGRYTLGAQPADSDFTPPTAAAVNTAREFFKFIQ